MADARKRKLDELEKRLDEVEQTQERQGKTTVNLQRRIDRLDKSSTLVLERADEVEDLYKAAEQSRDFKNLARDTSAAVLKRHQRNGRPLALKLGQFLNTLIVEQWWLLSQALPNAIQFVTPIRHSKQN